MGQIQKMSNEINFDDLTYCFTSPNLVPIKFMHCRRLLNIYNEIKNNNVSIKNAEGDQKFKRSKDQNLNQV